MDFIRPRNGNAALDKMIPFRDQPLDLTTGYRHLYPNATPDKPTVAAIGEALRSSLRSNQSWLSDARLEKMTIFFYLILR
ncbi:hypothetical protein ACLKA6_013738 [Drosophila palustris]